jgi:hypothetical protein
MLRPYACVACEKVILAADGVASLISLFNKIIITVLGQTEIPKNAVAPKEWAIFASWDVDPGDELKEYIFCTQMLYPDQSQFGEIAKNKIKIELNKRSQVSIQIIGFPIGQVGQYTVRTWIEENQQRVLGPIEFKIELEMTKQEQPQKAT